MDEAFAKINDLINLIPTLPTTVTNATRSQWMNQGNFGTIAGPFYWAHGKDWVLDNVINRIDTSIGSNQQLGRLRAVMGIAQEIIAADGNFENAKLFIEELHPMDDNYTLLNSTFEGYVAGLTYSNTSNPIGISAVSRAEGRFDVAEQALDYLSGIMHDALEHYVANGQNPALFHTPTSFASRYSALMSIYRAVDEYIALGKYEKAKLVLDDIMNYLSTNIAMPASFVKSKAYATAGYFYAITGYPMESNMAYQSAVVSASVGTYSAIDKVYHYLGLAYDATYRQLSNKNAVVASNLERALQENSAVANTNTTSTTSRGYQYIKIAETYARIFDFDNASAAIELAKEAALTLGGSGLLGNMRAIAVAYATIGDIETAYEYAYSLHDNTGDQNGTLRAIGEAILARDDFPNSDIAFIDTDKDGKPDFFLPWATEEEIARSRLVLDDDIDGDGKPDTVDKTPYYAD
jgi:hypothetical protein